MVRLFRRQLGLAFMRALPTPVKGTSPFKIPIINEGKFVFLKVYNNLCQNIPFRLI